MPNDIGALDGDAQAVWCVIWRGRALCDLNPVHGYALCVRIDREFYRMNDTGEYHEITIDLSERL